MFFPSRVPACAIRLKMWAAAAGNRALTDGWHGSFSELPLSLGFFSKPSVPFSPEGRMFGSFIHRPQPGRTADACLCGNGVTSRLEQTSAGPARSGPAVGGRRTLSRRSVADV